MGDLLQLENQYASYIGWYGVHGSNVKQLSFSAIDEIYSVFTIKNSRVQSYRKGELEFLQGITEFIEGHPYIIILEKGNQLVNIENFIASSRDDIKLVLENSDGHIDPDLNESVLSIPQLEETFSSHIGWYGVVNSNECEVENYDLKLDNRIDKVIRFNNGTAESYTSGQPDFLQTFTELEVGQAYVIVFKSGSSSITIKNFVSTSSFENLKNQKFKVRQKTKVFVCLWNFKNMFGNSVKSFKDESYYLGEFDNTNNPIKSKLTIADIENMLNQQNYIYPEQEDFDTKITGSVSDYFKSVTRHQIDLKFEIVNLGNNQYSTDPDDWAYSVVDRRRINDSNQLKMDIINSFSQIRRKYKANVFPKNFDDSYKQYDRKTAFGLVIHCNDSRAIRSRNLKVDPDSNDLLRRFSICNILDKSNSSRLEPIGVYVHELIHSFDLKDLYSNNVSAMSKIDTMGYGFWGFTKQSSGKYFPFFPSSYTRLKMFEFYKGVVDVVEIKKNTTDIELDSSVSSKKIIKLKNPNLPDIWYVDYRAETTTGECINFDRELGESGLSIVHEYPPIFDNRNPIPIHKRSESGLSVSLEQQDGLYHLQESGLSNIELDDASSADNKSDFFKEGDEFSPHTLPSSTSYLGLPSDIRLYNIRKTSRNTILFDVEFLEQPKNRILNVNYYTDQIKESNLVTQTCGNRRNCVTTKNSPFSFNFKEVVYQTKSIIIEITTKDIPDGTIISLYYLKKNAVKFTNPGGWASAPVNNNKVLLQIPRGLIGLYLQNQKNHFIYKVNGEEYSDTYWYIDFIHVIS